MEVNKVGASFNISRQYQRFTVDNLRQFVVRARIVQDHSLATDIGSLKRLATYEIPMDFQVDQRTGEHSARFSPVDLLPTEQVESAAARVRPVFLYSDGVFYADVLAYLYEQVEEEKSQSAILSLLKQYQVADPDYPHSAKGKPYQPGSSVSNNEMAGAWLYGSLLHEDVRRRSFAERFSLEEVYFHATKTVAMMMLAVVQTLHLIEQLVAQGTLDLPGELWTAAVTVQTASWTRPGIAKIYVAEVGTTAPADLSKPVDEHEGWRQVGIKDFDGE